MISNRRQLLKTGALAIPAGALLMRGIVPAAAATSRRIELTAADGHKLGAWRADPAGAPKGSIVALHAVFGCTTHLGDICAHWADAGYTAIAPALFDRIEKNLVHPYTLDGVKAGSASYERLTEAQIFADVTAAALAAGPQGKRVMSGFCTGGSWSWRSAAKLDLFAAQVNFYGSHVHTPEYFDLTPKSPTIIHYGDKDVVVPPDQSSRIRARHPEVEMHIYPGGQHAFMNPEQSSYDAAAAAAAWQSSIAFLDKHVAKA